MIKVMLSFPFSFNTKCVDILEIYRQLIVNSFIEFGIFQYRLYQFTQDTVVEKDACVTSMIFLPPNNCSAMNKVKSLLSQ